MTIESIKTALQEEQIFFSEESILDFPTVIGYEKKFKWSWFATQLNTFIVATDFGDKTITTEVIEKHLSESFHFAKQNYTGWPRGFQSALGVISILISSDISEEAKTYCRKLESGKKWAGFSIPVVFDSVEAAAFYFEKNPMWGRIYYPHFKNFIRSFE